MMEQGPWAREAAAFTRAFAGAFLFGVPLLFTMEVWWLGAYSDLWKLLVMLAVAFLANLGLTYASGFKRDRTFAMSIDQAIDVVAVGIVAATVTLLVLDRIAPGDPIDSILGKIIVQAAPLSIGASVANEIFGRRGERTRNGDDGSFEQGPWHAFFSDIGATAIGGVFVGMSIAPTEEVPMLAAGLDYHHLIALVGLTLVISYGIVFASGFDRQRSEGLFQRPITETALSYLVSLLVALASLYLFGQVEPGDPLRDVVAQVLVLAVPTTIGGAAGRLVI